MTCRISVGGVARTCGGPLGCRRLVMTGGYQVLVRALLRDAAALIRVGAG